MTASIRIIGSEDPVELAVVVALLTRRPEDDRQTGYERWRVHRTAALRASRRS